MKHLLLWSIFLWGIFSCTNNNLSTMKNTNDKSSLEKKELQEKEITPLSKDLNIADYQGRTVHKGDKTIIGILGSTKGHQAMVNGIILSYDFIKDKDTRRWKKEYQAMEGKKVEVKGQHYIYYCGPMEQCLQQGYIPSLRDIEYMKLVK